MMLTALDSVSVTWTHDANGVRTAGATRLRDPLPSPWDEIPDVVHDGTLGGLGVAFSLGVPVHI